MRILCHWRTDGRTELILLAHIHLIHMLSHVVAYTPDCATKGKRRSQHARSRVLRPHKRCGSYWKMLWGNFGQKRIQNVKIFNVAHKFLLFLRTTHTLTTRSVSDKKSPRKSGMNKHSGNSGLFMGFRIDVVVAASHCRWYEIWEYSTLTKRSVFSVL